MEIQLNRVDYIQVILFALIVGDCCFLFSANIYLFFMNILCYKIKKKNIAFFNLTGWSDIPENYETPSIFRKKSDSKGIAVLLKQYLCLTTTTYLL